MQLKKVAGLSSHQYTVAVRLFLDQNQPGLSLLHEQSARTRGISIDDSSAIVSVQWNEVFFFRIDSLVSILLPY